MGFEVIIIYVPLIVQVTRLHEEFFLPGEVIMEQGNVVDQLYFVCDGMLVRFIFPPPLLQLFNFYLLSSSGF